MLQKGRVRINSGEARSDIDVQNRSLYFGNLAEDISLITTTR